MNDMAGVTIQPLSPGVRSYLRTGVALSSVAQCMEELVLNSVDAGATCIAVRIDLSCFKIQVVDNGTGMTQGQLELVGQRYHTSKCHSVEDLSQLRHYGFRGEAIASLRDASSLLEITSRIKQITPTYCKMFNKGSAMKVVLSSVPRPSAGTTVTVHDLFYNMPVRRKAMNAVLEFERVKKRLEGIALMRPAISFSLRNDISGQVVLQTHKTCGVLNVFTSLYGVGRSKTLSPVQGQCGCYSVEGYIGKEGFSRKDLQFVYINKRLVLKTKIHKVINFVLGKSLVLRKKGFFDKQGESKQQESMSSMTSSPTKYSEKFGVFVINISCPYTEYDVTFDPAKTLVEFKDWNTVCTCIEDVMSEFLKRECLMVGIQDMTVDSPIEESMEDTAEISTDKGQVSIGDNSGGPGVEEISTSNNRNFLTSKLVRRVAKQEDSPDDCEEENVTKTTTGLDVMVTPAKVTNIEKKTDGSDIIEDKQSFRKNVLVEETDCCTSDTVVKVSETGQMDNPTSDSSEDSNKNCDRQHLDSDDVGTEVTDLLNDDGDYESEDPVPKFDWEFMEKRKDTKITENKHHTLIRLETPHVGFNGGSTLSLIRKGLSSYQGNLKDTSSKKTSCFKVIRKRLQCNKTSECNEKPSDGGQESHLTTTTHLPVSEICDFNKKEVAISHKGQLEKSIEKSKADSTQRIGESETECIGSGSQENMQAYRLPKKRSTVAECSVAAKLARMSRSHQQVGVSRDKALDSELDNTVHQTRHTITETSHNTAASSKYPQDIVPPNLHGNQSNLFDRSCLIVHSNGIRSTKEKIEHENSTNITSVNSRKTANTTNAHRKFLTTTSFLQTYNDVFQNYSGSEETSYQDRNKCNNSEIDHLGKRSSDHQCHTTGCILTNSYEGWKSTKQVTGDSDMTPDNYTRTESNLGIEPDSTNTGINKDISLCVGGGDGLFQFISSESETDSAHDGMLFEGTPNSERQLGMYRGDDSINVSETDLLCYEEFDYAPVPPSNKESADLRNPQQVYQILDRSKPCIDSVPVPDTTVSLQGEEKTYDFNTTLNLGDMESSSDYTMERTQGFVHYLTHTDILSSNLVTARLSGSPQSQGFVPLTDISTVMDKQGLNTECLQESQGFVPVPAFTENRVISPAVSEGFSPVMMDDDLKLDKNSSGLSKHLHEDPNSSSHHWAIKSLCEDSNGSVSTTNQRKEIQVEEPSTHQEMETLAEFLDSYSSSIADLYEEDMSYVVKTKKRRMSSTESLESPVTSVIHENSLSSVSKSQSDLSDSIPTQLTTEIYKTQAHFRKVSEDSVQELSDSSNVASNKNFSQLSIEENSEASSGTCALGKVTTKIIDEHICLTEENQGLSTSNDEINYTDIGGNRQQNVSQYVKPGYVSKNVQHVIMSDEEERCVPCESIQNSTEVVSEGTDQTALSNTERTFDSPDTDDDQVIQLELFQSCNSIHDSDKYKTMASQCLSTLPYRNSESSTNSKLERKTTLNVPGLSSKQLKVLRGESNRKGKLPMNIIDICDKSKIESSVKGDKSESTDTSGDTSPWSDVDEGDLLTVTENGQSCEEQNLNNKIDTIDIKMDTKNDKIKSSESKKDTVKNLMSTSEDTCTIDSEQPWVEIKVPTTGEKLYVNSITGHNRPQDGSWEPPPPDAPSTTKSTVNDLSPQSHNTLLQIMSEHMETIDKEDEDLLSVKWADTRHGSDSTEDKQTPVTTKCVEDLLQNWDNPVFDRPEQSVATMVEASRRSQGSSKAHGILHYHKFTKDMLQDVKVIGQVDNKFIACMTSSRTNKMSAVPNLLLLFDQHAAHERVRLQKLTKEAYERDNRICRSTVTPAKQLTLEEEEVRVMVSYREEFARIGVDFTTDKQSRDTILVHTIPACIMQKEVNEVKRKRESVAWNVVLNLLKEHVELLMSTSGVLGRLPATLHKVLCSQACHGAIKFGDPLSVEECKELLDSLSHCDLPFQCAHGRPSLMPLLELDKLESNNKTRKPNLWKISKKIQTSKRTECGV
ncbi:uncharacterized protein [Argopecten irradians]|uniref:uncharacterized protein isoform X2 n=1 Tax=Argopecten irradians TaxID=31199 RepID=UPI0037196268